MPLISLLISIAFSAADAKIGSAIMLFIMLAAGVFLIVKGATGLSLAKRFDQYVRSLENSEYADKMCIRDRIIDFEKDKFRFL